MQDFIDTFLRWWKSYPASKSSRRFVLVTRRTLRGTSTEGCQRIITVFIINSPLCRSVCVVPVWPSQSCLCRWFWAAGSFRCAGARLNTRRWSYDIGHRVSGWTSRYLSLIGWPTGRYAEERETNRQYNQTKHTLPVISNKDFSYNNLYEEL